MRALGISSRDVGLCLNTAHLVGAGNALRTERDVYQFFSSLPVEWIHLIYLNGVGPRGAS